MRQATRVALTKLLGPVVLGVAPALCATPVAEETWRDWETRKRSTVFVSEILAVLFIWAPPLQHYLRLISFNILRRLGFMGVLAFRSS